MEQRKLFIPAKTAETEPKIQYGISGQMGMIDLFTATNTGLEAATISVYIVPKGEEIGPQNAIVSYCTIAPGEACTCPELKGQIIGDGESIATQASADGVTIRCSGRLL